jgi:Protein of unknown function (DUF3108)
MTNRKAGSLGTQCRIAAASVLLLVCASAWAADSTAAFVPQPSKVTFHAEFRGINVGTIDYSLREESPGRYVYQLHGNAEGLAAMIIRNDPIEASTFVVENNVIKPVTYVLDDGSKSTAKDTRLTFDWTANVARGEHEDQPVELTLTPGLQDRMSLQILIMQKLAAGMELGRITFIDRNRIREYVYTAEGTSVQKTAIGDVETVVYSSTREGSSRINRYWFAPKLGFLPVRLEQVRNGKVESVLTVIKMERQ